MSGAGGTTGGRAAFLRVGLLVAVGGALAVALALFLGGNTIRNGRIYETYFEESVQGLEIGAPVKFRGVTLGQVTGIGLASAAYLRDRPADLRSTANRLVYVRYIIDPGRVGQMVSADMLTDSGLRAKLASQGITGLAYIELDFFDPAQYPAPTLPWTPEYDTIASVPSTLTQVQDAAQTLLARLNAVDLVGLVRAAQRLLDDLHAELATGDAHQALSGTAALAATLRETVTRADLPGLTAELRSTAAALRTLAGGPQTREALAATTRAATGVAEAAARLPALFAVLEATLRRAGSGITDLQSDLAPVLRDARAAAANLRATTEELRRYPSGVLLGGPPPREAR